MSSHQPHDNPSFLPPFLYPELEDSKVHLTCSIAPPSPLERRKEQQKGQLYQSDWKYPGNYITVSSKDGEQQHLEKQIEPQLQASMEQPAQQRRSRSRLFQELETVIGEKYFQQASSMKFRDGTTDQLIQSAILAIINMREENESLIRTVQSYYNHLSYISSRIAALMEKSSST